MTRIVFALALATSLAVPIPAAAAAAAPASNGLTIPVVGTVGAGGSFTGNFNLTRFATNSTGQLVAIGMLTGVITNAAGAVVGSVAQALSVPLLDPTTS